MYVLYTECLGWAFSGHPSRWDYPGRPLWWRVGANGTNSVGSTSTSISSSIRATSTCSSRLGFCGGHIIGGAGTLNWTCTQIGIGTCDLSWLKKILNPGKGWAAARGSFRHQAGCIQSLRFVCWIPNCLSVADPRGSECLSRFSFSRLLNSC